MVKQLKLNIVEHSRASWNAQSKNGSRWCKPVSEAEIKAARNGNWEVILTPNKNVPHDWFGSLKDKKILCLASGGGQQAPMLAAAGAEVTSFDNSDEQLAKDRFVADRDSLELRTVRGDMSDLSIFEDGYFDLIFHPVSNVFAENIVSVWRECFRVLNWEGRLLSGFMNPAFFLFDYEEAKQTGELKVKYSLPYSDLKNLDEAKLSNIVEEGIALEFGHTIEQQIGGQLNAGFIIAKLYEDYWDDESTLLNKYTPTYIATLAIKIQI